MRGRETRSSSSIELLSRFHRRPSVVFKESLAIDPCVDLLAHRLPQAMIDTADREECEARIGELTAALGPRGALLLFPEGGNFTTERRRSALRHLWRKGEHRSAERAESMPNVMPPQPGGALAALGARPDADVVFAAHTGLGLAAYPRQFWRDMPIGRTLHTRMWLVPRRRRPADRRRAGELALRLVGAHRRLDRRGGCRACWTGNAVARLRRRRQGRNRCHRPRQTARRQPRRRLPHARATSRGPSPRPPARRPRPLARDAVRAPPPVRPSARPAARSVEPSQQPGRPAARPSRRARLRRRAPAPHEERQEVADRQAAAACSASPSCAGRVASAASALNPIHSLNASGARGFEKW